jgi:hypothetical protein
MSIIIATLPLFLFFNVNDLINTYLNRFGSEGSLSTHEKLYQYKLIFNKILNNHLLDTLLGTGLGSYIPNYIRYDVIGYRYGYEAFEGILLYQLGLIFFLFVVFLLIYPLLKNYKLILKPVFIFYTGMYILFLIHGLVNPLILTAPSSFILGLLYIKLINLKNE